MATALVFCLAPSHDLASQIVDRVKTSGFSNYGISALFPDEEAARDLEQTKNARPHRREQMSTSQRTAWWAARRSGFVSIGALAIPGLGPFVAAGPIIFALSGAMAGGERGGGLAGVLMGMGVSESEASRYESKIKEGSILISVRAENPADITLAKTILQQSGAQDIHATTEACLEEGTAPERTPGPVNVRPEISAPIAKSPDPEQRY